MTSPPTHTKACPNCGTEFEPIRRTQTYCSKACNHEARHRAAKSRQNTPAKLHDKTCEWCGDPFQTPDYRTAYCSKACKAAEDTFDKTVGKKLRRAALAKSPVKGNPTVFDSVPGGLSAMSRTARDVRDQRLDAVAKFKANRDKKELK